MCVWLYGVLCLSGRLKIFLLNLPVFLESIAWVALLRCLVLEASTSSSVLCSLNVCVLCYIPNLRSKDSGLHFNCPSFQSRPTSLHCWCSSLIGDYCSGGCSPMPPRSFGFEASTSAWVKDWLEAQATELYTFFVSLK